ncbi:MAG TPA: YjgN family protein [Burkholderiales bacterium]|nr:YjgN family protein [Burkholderiales bacterium]
MERTGAPEVALQFTGKAGEYFKIWIVNLCLGIVTLGIYSAWAKVRRKRYFYGSTLLDGSAFEYIGNPVAILKGRLIVVTAVAIYSLSKQVHYAIGLALFAAIVLALPWVIQRALQFNARNSTHRNIRFGFRGSKMQIFGVLAIAGLLVPVTLGFAYPFYFYMKRKVFIDNSNYGDRRFVFSATAGNYYVAALKVSLAFLGFVAGTVVTLGIGALPLYILLSSYAEATFARLAWRNTTLGAGSGEIRFECRWTTGGLFGLYFGNALGVLCTLGLLIPWAAIRTARYKLERISLQSEQGLGGFLAAVQEDVGAVGDEAGELLGFDFGL